MLCDKISSLYVTVVGKNEIIRYRLILLVFFLSLCLVQFEDINTKLSVIFHAYNIYKLFNL